NAARYVITDVNKDGTLTGPNIDLLTEISKFTKKPLIASGGISELDDLVKLKSLVNLGVEGAIVGKALYSNKFTLKQALEVAGK
ncbi:MAG: 1-(5-phosphoribosyl)-5-[(5-phosphoribosylamino)methylideneamino] imidazole-4-carboxamide isomerase, partial [Actinomycetota bacterium]